METSVGTSRSTQSKIPLCCNYGFVLTQEIDTIKFQTRFLTFFLFFKFEKKKKLKQKEQRATYFIDILILI